MIHTVSITELKQNTAGVVGKVSAKFPIVILQRSKPAAVLVDPDYYEKLEQMMEEAQDLCDIELRKDEPTVALDEYFLKRFKKN